MKKCPYCAEEIQNAALVCKHCSRDLPLGSKWIARANFASSASAAVITPPTRTRTWSPGVAAALTFLIPGLGQIYKGRLALGLLVLLLAVLGYAMLVFPGLIVHLVAIVDAYSGKGGEEL